MKAIHIFIQGTVQGVGFRPFVFHLAHKHNIKGWIQNSSQGVEIHAEGSSVQQESFILDLKQNLPPHCTISNFQSSAADYQNFREFSIIGSAQEGQQSAFVLPDISSCNECLKEVFDANNRRYLYPFTNCTHCGPRYSIIERLPYDRKNTSMKHFLMCPACQQEYDDPSNRRFHAQPNACPDCGPWLELWDAKGNLLSSRHEAMQQTVQFLKEGLIVAVKGLGGFHLMLDAGNPEAVQKLRKRKGRPDKPLALMFSSVDAVKAYCEMNPSEEDLLKSAQTPIVLLRKKSGSKLAEELAPGNPYLGSMLPSLPLQHILSELFGSPLVATSANISEEPVCIDNQEALKRLSGLADFFLVHNRPILRQVDDSVLQEVNNTACFLRRSRGFAPLPVFLAGLNTGVLAVGSHQKNTVAISIKDQAILSQHIGDLDTTESVTAFKQTIKMSGQIYSSGLAQVVCDMHPDYASSCYARDLKLPILEVQHHHAHVASCMAEHGIKGAVLGVCFDGTGFGPDKTIWGGEFLLCQGSNFKRFAHLMTFPLPGGEIAIKEPRRSALGMLSVLGKLNDFTDLPCFHDFRDKEHEIIGQMLSKKINSPLTSSMGRLFDAVASLLDLCQRASFEGQAAMALEYQVQDSESATEYPYLISENITESCLIIDWRPVIHSVITDIRQSLSPALISGKFHKTLTAIIADIARRSGQRDIILSGGCFQNKVLIESATDRLRSEGFNPIWHTKVPCNDGGISLGQLYVQTTRNPVG